MINYKIHIKHDEGNASVLVSSERVLRNEDIDEIVKALSAYFINAKLIITELLAAGTA